MASADETRIARLGIHGQRTDIGSLVAFVIDIVLAENLVTAAYGEYGDVVLDGLLQTRGFGADNAHTQIRQ